MKQKRENGMRKKRQAYPKSQKARKDKKETKNWNKMEITKMIETCLNISVIK